MTQQFTLIQPDDWHAHFRDGAMLKTVVPFTARQFARAIVMPNLKPPVVTTAMAESYRDRIRAAVPDGCAFDPLMTLYLTDATDADDVASGFERGIVTAAKLYPANATTNSEHGVSSISKIAGVCERMQKIGMPILIHGEVTDPAIDIFDREKYFIDRVLIPLLKDFPELKIVFEHITTSDAADFVLSQQSSGKLGATVTAHHLIINRNDLLVGGIKPHHYCLPIVKRENHRQALVQAVTSGAKCFFPGTDSAPHARAGKESACGCAGIFTALNAIELYACVFAKEEKMQVFEQFMSLNGPAFYGLPVNKTKIILEHNDHEDLSLPDSLPIEEGADAIVPFQTQQVAGWRVVGTL